MTTLYLAYPIDQAGRGHTSLGALEVLLTENGAQAYWPRRPWTFNGTVDTEVIDMVNQAAQGAIQNTLALLPYGIPTYGVPVEIERCLHEGWPVTIWADRATVQVDSWGRRGAVVMRSLPDAVRAAVEFEKPTSGQKEGNEGTATVLVEVRDPAGAVPKQAYAGDAGFDLACTRDLRIHDGEFVDVPCGIAIELPPGMWGWVIGRSSTLRTKGLLVNPGIIDNGWRGEYFVGVKNVSGGIVEVKTGERLAQLIPMPLLADRIRFEQTGVLSETSRGTNGFGSSGA